MKKRRRFATLKVTAVALSLALGITACGSSDSGGGGDKVSLKGGAAGVDDGTKLTLWTRATVEKPAGALVDAYNSSHKNQVELTVVPNDDYVAKVGAAAGSGGLPDLFAAGIVYVPNWGEEGVSR